MSQSNRKRNKAYAIREVINSLAFTFPEEDIQSSSVVCNETLCALLGLVQASKICSILRLDTLEKDTEEYLQEQNRLEYKEYQHYILNEEFEKRCSNGMNFVFSPDMQFNRGE